MSLRIVYIIVFIAFFSSAFRLSAQQKSRQVQQLENKRLSMLKDIAKTDKELKAIYRSASNVKKRIDLLERQVKQRREVLRLIDSELQVLDREIDSMSRRCATLMLNESAAKDSYAHAVRAMQINRFSLDKILFVFSSGSFDQGIRRLSYLTQYADAQKRAASDLQSARKAVERQRADIAVHRAGKQQTKALRENERKKLEQEENARKQEAKQLASKQTTLQQKLTKQQAQATALSRKIEQQIAYEIAEAERKARLEREAQERRRAEAERQRAEDARRREGENKKRGGKTKPPRAEKSSELIPPPPTRRAATQGGYAMDATERALSGSFEANKGRLPAPVRGRYSVEIPYGSTAHSQNSQITTNNTGIDLAVGSGTDASSVFDGVVTAIFVQPGYNTAVIVRHGNYLTIYANLSSVYVSKGQKIKTGQPIGRIFTDSASKKTLLHFELWKERSRQNPSVWIR